MPELEELYDIELNDNFFLNFPKNLGFDSYEDLNIEQNKSTILQKLKSSNLESDRRAAFGETLLHFAVIAGNLEALKTLVALGYDIHAVNKDGQNIIHYAALNGHEVIVEALLDNSMGITFNCGSTTLNGMNILHFAALNGHLSIIIKAVTEYGFDVYSTSTDGQTILHYAALRGQVNLIKDLLLHGFFANKNNEDINGFTPLQLAAWKGDVSVLTAMIEEAGFDPNYVNSKQQHLLFRAQGDCIAFCKNTQKLERLYATYHADFTQLIKKVLLATVTPTPVIQNLIITYLGKDIYNQIQQFIQKRNQVLQPLIFFTTAPSQREEFRQGAKTILNNLLAKKSILPEDLKKELAQALALPLLQTLRSDCKDARKSNHLVESSPSPV